MPKGIPKNGTRINRSAERRKNRHPFIDPNQFYGLVETSAFRDQCEALTWRDISTGLLKCIKRGKRVVFLGAWIIEANHAEARLHGKPLDVA